MVFSTSASIDEYGRHVYSDDKSFSPPYDLTPYVREDTLDKYPEIADILNQLIALSPDRERAATPERVAKCRKVWQKPNAEKMVPKEVVHKYLYKSKLNR
nr:hypothetical protein [Deltaproteobacteria bacterium]